MFGKLGFRNQDHDKKRLWKKIWLSELWKNTELHYWRIPLYFYIFLFYLPLTKASKSYQIRIISLLIFFYLFLRKLISLFWKSYCKFFFLLQVVHNLKIFYFLGKVIEFNCLNRYKRVNNFMLCTIYLTSLHFSDCL